MKAARALVERAAEHTYGVNTGFGRFVSESIPDDQVEELQLRLLRSHACGVGEPYPDEVVRAAMLLRANALAKGYSGARVETVELLIECLNRGRAAARPRARLGRRERRPRAARAPGAAARRRGSRRGSTATLLGGAEALAARRARADHAGGEGGALADQRHAVHGRDGRARARARATARRASPTSPARSRSRRCRARARASTRRSTQARPHRGQVDSAANVRRLLEGSAIIESHRWCDKVQDAYSLRCAPQVHGASRDLLDYVEATVADRGERRDRQPARARRRGPRRLERQLPRPAARLRARLAGDRGRRAREHLRAARRAARQPDRSPTGCRRSSRVEGGLNSGFMIPQYVAAALVSENKVALPPGERRLDPDERRPGGSRLDGERGRAEGAAGARERRARARDRAARGRAGDRVPRSARARAGRPRDPRRRARALRAAARGPLALRRHRARRRCDPRRVDRSRPPSSRSERSRERRDRSASPVPKHPVPRYRAPQPRPRRADRPHRLGSRAATLGRALVFATLYFVVATAWTWWRFQQAPARKTSSLERLRRSMRPSRRSAATSRAIRAPRGTTAERPLVADRSAAADAAEQPRPRGRRAARGARRLRRLGPGGALARGAARRSCARCCASRDDETLLVQSGKPVGVFRTHEGAPRVLIANSLLVPQVGDLGRVPPARGRGADDVRADDRRELDLHRHAGDPAGHLPDVRRGGREALRLGRPQRPDDPHGRARRHGRRAAARGDDGRRGDPLHRGRPDVGSSAGSRRATSTRSPTRSTTRSRGCARRPPRGGRSRSRCSGNAAEIVPELVRRGVNLSTSSPTRRRRTIRSPATSRSGSPSRKRLRCARPTPTSTSRRARESIVAHVEGAARVRPRGQLCLRLWQQPARGGL